MEINSAFRGVWVPRSIWISKELTLSEKSLMIEIDRLSNTAQGCSASNSHFSIFLE